MKLFNKKQLTRDDVFRFLKESGYVPEIDGEQSNIIWFTCEEWKWFVMLRDNSNSVMMGMSVGMGDKKQTDMSILWDSVNMANREVFFAKAFIEDDAFRFQVEFQCDSADAFKRHFRDYARSVFAMTQRVSDIISGFDKLKTDREQTETPYDKIHYHTAYVAIPRTMSQISKYPKETAMRLDNVRSLKIGLLPEMTRDDVSAFPWDDLKITQREIEDGKRLMVYEFPTPRRSPQAKFAVVLMDSENVPMDYVTLERSCNSEDNELEQNTPELNTNVVWMLGTVVNRKDGIFTHRNYGLFQEEPTLENFIQAAMDIFNTPKEQRKFFTRG